LGKKKWEIVKATRAPIVGIGVNGKMRKFGRDNDAFVVRDAGEAREIEEMYGSHSKTGNRSVVVCEVPERNVRVAFQNRESIRCCL